MSFIGSDVNDDLFIPEFQEEQGQDEDITVDDQNEDASPEEGQEAIIEEGVEENKEEEQPLVEQPKKYAGKFDSVEDLEKAYQNLQPSFTKASMELSRLRKEVVTPPSVQPQQGTVGQGSTNPANTQYPDVISSIKSEVYQQVYNDVVMPLKQRIDAQDEITNQMVIESELSKMATRYDDFKEVAPVMMQVLNEKKGLLQLDDFLEVAYTLAQKQVNETKLERKVSEAKKEAYKSREIKEINSDIRTHAKTNATNQGSKDQGQQILDAILDIKEGGSLFRK